MQLLTQEGIAEFSMKKLLAIIVLGLCFFNSAQATMTTGAFLEIINDKNENTKQMREYTLKLALLGMANGYIHANYELGKIKGQEKFFCMPKKFKLNTKNLISITDRQIKEDIKAGMDVKKYGVHLFLFEGLKNTFPCK